MSATVQAGNDDPHKAADGGESFTAAQRARGRWRAAAQAAIAASRRRSNSHVRQQLAQPVTAGHQDVQSLTGNAAREQEASDVGSGDGCALAPAELPADMEAFEEHLAVVEHEQMKEAKAVQDTQDDASLVRALPIIFGFAISLW